MFCKEVEYRINNNIQWEMGYTRRRQSVRKAHIFRRRSKESDDVSRRSPSTG